MSPDPIIKIRFEAFAVGMKAIYGDLPKEDVDAMMTRAEEALASDDPLFRAITGFAVQYEQHRMDKAQLSDLGQSLTRFINSLNNSELPLGSERLDIYG